MTSYSPALLRWVLGVSGHPGGVELTRHAAALTGVEAGARVVDVGCGRGASVLLLAAEHGARAVGIDIDARAASAVRRSRAAVVRGDALELPVRDDAADVVLCEWALSAFPAPARAVAEMVRVLTPGGRLAIADVTAEPDLRRTHPRVDRALRRLMTPMSPVEHANLLARARLQPVAREERSADALAAVERVRSRLRPLAAAPGIATVRAIAAEAADAIRAGSLGYTLLVARKPG